MRKLSSDTLYYKGFVGLFIGPILIVLFVNYFMVDNVPSLFKYFIYFLVLILIITQARLAFKTRQVSYNKEVMRLETYFTKQSEEVQIPDILSLSKAFSLQKERDKCLFKLIYLKGDKKCTIYFFSALNPATVDDLDVFIGLDKLLKSVK